MEIKILNARNVYSDLGEPRSLGRDASGKPHPPKYSGSFILTPDNPALASIEAGTQSLFVERFGTDAKVRYKETKAANLLLLHSGDEKARYPEYENNFFFSASAWPDDPPKFYNKNPKLPDGEDNLIAPAQVGLVLYGGSYVNVKVKIYLPKDKPNVSLRVCAILLAVQAYRDGDRFGRFNSSSGDDWEDVSTGEEKATADTGGAW